MNFVLKERHIAANDQGIEVYPEASNLIIYKEGNKKLTMMRQPDWIEGMIHVNYIRFLHPLKWDKPHEDLSPTPEEIMKIKSRVTEALELFNCQAIFDKPTNMALHFRGGGKVANE